MADFSSAVTVIFYLEGYESDSENDHGGFTRYGISQAAHPEVDVSILTIEQAKEIYRTEYWAPSRAGSLNDQRVANKYFSFYVNMRPVPAVRILQAACGDCGHPTWVDGVPGDLTMKAANACNPDSLLEALKQRAKDHYYAIVAADPSQSKWLKGWLNRVNA